MGDKNAVDYLLCRDAELSESGHITALVARIGVTNKNRMKLMPGVLGGDGRQPIIVSKWNHDSVFMGGSQPVGAGEVYEKDGYVHMDAQLFMDTQGGKETFSMLKGLGSTAEYSVSVHHDGQEFEVVREGENFIREVTYGVIKEVSPVDMGADRYTKTMDLSKHQDEQPAEKEKPQDDDVLIVTLKLNIRDREDAPWDC